jgi:serpin B
MNAPLRVLAPVPLLLLILAGCRTNDETDDASAQARKEMQALSASERDLVQADNAFGLRLFSSLAAEDTGRTVFISPLSVSLALAMAYNGAGGRTATDMAATLGFAGKDRDAVNAFYARLQPALASADPHARFEIANSVWSKEGYPVAPDFLDRNRETFGAETRALDFASAGAAKAINGWVSDKTKGRISGIVQDPLDPDLRVLLINAVYFKGE